MHTGEDVQGKGEEVQVKQLKVIWFDPWLNDVEAADSQRLVQAVRDHLEDYGLVFVVCTDTDAVYREASDQVTAPAGHGAGALVVLNADFARNCAVTHYLRAAVPGVCIVVRVPNYHEQTLMHALQSGADSYFCSPASPRFLSTLLFSRLRGGGLSLPPVNLLESGLVPDQAWCFAEQSWAVVGPDGTRVRLTSSERAFLLALTGQPEMCASHEVLIKQLWLGSNTARQSGRERMSVMVSRLRQKFKEKGLELPIRTLHGSGYMFSGPLIEEQRAP
ncbi:MAG: winged helix-turn-helix domain-containing protein [Pusillimonas sp.]|nr:winged helix-turn-helix domain-containing protein [Pusillimonas sp.]